jgi:hypothetical protein
MTGGYGDDWDEPEDGDPDQDDEEGQRPFQPQTAWGDSDAPEGEAGEDLIKRMARSHSELAMQTLADVAANGDKSAARVAAAKEMLARGYGMPTRKSEQKVDVKIHDQRLAHFEALKTMATRNPVLDIQDAEFDEIPDTRRLENRKRRDDDDE